jgi:hypothetical protein
MTWGQIRLQAQKWGENVDMDVLDQAIQARYATILDAHPWKALDKQATIQTVGVYATGTVSVTNGSASITGTTTAWTQSQSGLSVRVGSDSQFYTFTYTGATAGTLDRPYEGTTDATAPYYLFQSVYALPSDLKILLEVNNLRGNFPLRPYTQAELNLLFPARTDVGEPFIYSMAQDTAPLQPQPYAAGTLALTHGSNAVTGSGTAWVAGQSGMLMRVGNDVVTYTFTYLSGTTAALDQNYQGTTAAAASYVLTPAPPVHQVELYKIPQNAGGYLIRYTQIPPTFDPTQTTQSPLPWVPQQVLINGVRADLLSFAKDYAGMQAYEALFTSGLNEMLRVELHRQPNSRVSEQDRYQGPANFPMPPGYRRGGPQGGPGGQG